MTANLVVPRKLIRDTLIAVQDIKNTEGTVIDGRKFGKMLQTRVPEIKKYNKVIIRQLMMHVSKIFNISVEEGKVIIRGLRG